MMDKKCMQCGCLWTEHKQTGSPYLRRCSNCRCNCSRA
ncbi:hypothetical protein DICA3_D00650 [Diutina catenulata]